MLKDEQLRRITSWQQSAKVNQPFDEAYQCQSRDVFQAKLDILFGETKNPLLVAVTGEIGNNSFDHNLGKWLDIAGVYFKYFADKRVVIIADRGQGVKQTLAKIVPKIKDDKMALEIAFTKTISGRSPEQRGNGLKFVAKAVKDNNWSLYFKSGNGVAKIDSNGSVFEHTDKQAYGCLAILKF